MKTIKVNHVFNRSYDGSIQNAPMWLRALVTPWYRRFLMWPFTIYIVVIGGIAASHVTEGWESLLVGLPAHILLLLIAQKAQISWYEKIYRTYEEKHPTPKKDEQKSTSKPSSSTPSKS